MQTNMDFSKRMVSWLSVLSLIFLTQCHSGSRTVEDLKLVKVDTVLSCSSVSVVDFPGSVQPGREVKLAFRVAGPIASLPVEEGQMVRKGALIAQIDPRDYEIQLAATKAEYEQIKGEAQRIIELHKRQSVSENDYEKAVAGLNRITAKYEAHKNALADTRLVAPFDGFIQWRYYQKDETVAAGMPVVSIISVNQLSVEVDLPAKDYLNRDQFDRFYCLSDVYPGQRFPLQFSEIVHQGNQNQLYRLRLDLAANETYPLAAGMSVSVQIEFKKEDRPETIIPLNALFYEQNQAFVWVYNTGTSVVERRAVTVSSIDDQGRVMVREGVQSGEIIVSGGVHTLKPGEKVRILPATTKSNVGGIL